MAVKPSTISNSDGVSVIDLTSTIEPSSKASSSASKKADSSDDDSGGLSLGKKALIIIISVASAVALVAAIWTCVFDSCTTRSPRGADRVLVPSSQTESCASGSSRPPSALNAVSTPSTGKPRPMTKCTSTSTTLVRSTALTPSTPILAAACAAAPAAVLSVAL